MGVYIKSMKIPDDCRECPFEGYHVDIGQTYCMACLKVLATAFKPISFDGRPKWCPLVSVPEPHGRLIDVDKFNEFIEKHCADNLADLWKELVRRQPTVIEAEDE